MTHPTLDHEERLRSALRAAADSVEPAADGLERIRARLTPPRPLIAAWMVAWAEPVTLRLRLAVPWLRLRLGLAPAGSGRSPACPSRARPAWHPVRRDRPAPIADSAGRRPAPGTCCRLAAAAAAMAAFVVMVGSGALAISQLQQTATLAGRAAAVRPQREAAQLRPRWRRGRRRRRAPADEPMVEEPRRRSPRPSEFSMSLLAPSRSRRARTVLEPVRRRRSPRRRAEPEPDADADADVAAADAEPEPDADADVAAGSPSRRRRRRRRRAEPGERPPCRRRAAAPAGAPAGSVKHGGLRRRPGVRLRSASSSPATTSRPARRRAVSAAGRASAAP